ncbi:D-alanine aminotransferase [mine drainage metagenome]|uniref:D-alanine aminotransferase n=1 Tax=mine drainage metagenome TaxID=410659 RepID=A0A1J5SYD5_9ZZZZ
MTVWLNGSLLDEAAARIDPSDRGLTLADGLFETLCLKGGKVRHLAAHLARLRAGADCLGFQAPRSDTDIAEAMLALAKAHSQADGLLRLTLTRGPAPRGLLPPAQPQPTLLITLAPAVPDPAPARAILATVTRRNEFSPASRFKTLNYIDNLLARREAAARGADDALLLNSQGRLAESTIANLFLVIDGAVLTPPVADGALPGVMRADVIDRLGAGTAPLHPADLAVASEAFLTNAAGIRALVMVDGHAIGGGHPGPVTTRLKGLVG